MQIRCTHCTKTVALATTGELPAVCPHCARAPGPGALGPYEPLRLIATGGMGEVYLARHRELGTEVALKVLPAMPLDAIAGVRERFAREARLTAKVKHPGVVKVHGNDQAGDRPYLVLEFVAGQTLRQRLQDGPLPVVEAARLVAETADVLAAAHREGVLHRDIKPDNVMVTPEGDVRVLDFGIARGLQDDAPITRTGEIVGTPEYMAPEQLLDGPDAITERTDVHALGVLLYELLTGRSPFHGANVFQALKLVESLVPPPPSELRAEVTKELDAVVMHALQKHRDDRLVSAARFAIALRSAVPEAVARSAPASSPWRTIGLTAAAVLVLVAVTGYLVVQQFVLPALRTTLQSGGDIRALVKTTKSLAQMRHLLAAGRWWQAARDADSALAAGEQGARVVAQDAFLLTHCVWPLLGRAPVWLGRCDELERQRLFQDAGESPPIAEPSAAARLLLGRGDAAGASRLLHEAIERGARLDRDTLRVMLLADRLIGRGPIPATASQLDGDCTFRLLCSSFALPEEHVILLRDHANSLPSDEPEHWLARRCADRGSAPIDSTPLAESAWLHGAGELAVLLDASMHVIATNGVGLLPAASIPALRRRVGRALTEDSPASGLLVTLLDALDGKPLDLTAARSFPAAERDAAHAWFVTAALANPTHRDALLHIATGLGARPDYTASPWSDVPSERRAELDVESQRGR